MQQPLVVQNRRSRVPATRQQEDRPELCPWLQVSRFNRTIALYRQRTWATSATNLVAGSVSL